MGFSFKLRSPSPNPRLDTDPSQRRFAPLFRAGQAARYMQDKKKKVSLESLNESLTKAAKSLDKAAGQIRDLSLEPTSKNIRLIGESLANISDLQHLIYEIKPELTPEFLKTVPPYPRKQGKALTRAMAYSFKEEEKGNIKAAVKLLEDFLATGPDKFLKKVAATQIKELRRKYSI